MIRPRASAVSQVQKQEATTDLPWLPRDLVNMTWTTLVGASGLFVGYAGSSGTARVSSQLPWIALAVGTVAVAGVGNALWLAAGARVTGARRHELARRCAALTLQDPADAEDGVGSQRQSRAVGTSLVATSDMTRYHFADCPLVLGKSASPASEQYHLDSGRRPCGICIPPEVS